MYTYIDTVRPLLSTPPVPCVRIMGSLNSCMLPISVISVAKKIKGASSGSAI
ncbi:hypothetical protein D3C78_1883210 [compost metagenome]